MRKDKSWFRYTVKGLLDNQNQKAIYFDIIEDTSSIGVTESEYIATVITVNSRKLLFRYVAYSSRGNVYVIKDRCIGSIMRKRKYI